jgi:oligoribonuclease
MTLPEDHLIWIDLEMTGLEPLKNHILEIATLITDSDLNEIAIGPNLAIYQPDEILNEMDDWNQTHHTQSGLIKRVKASTVDAAEAERQTLAFFQKYVKPASSPMCGNSICQDRRFLHRFMPSLEAYFHYRNLDVSTVKELTRRWAPEVFKRLKKQNNHLALDDIRESISELKYYRDTVFKLPTKD